MTRDLNEPAQHHAQQRRLFLLAARGEERLERVVPEAVDHELQPVGAQLLEEHGIVLGVSEVLLDEARAEL